MSSSQGSSALSNGTEDEQREDLHGADKGENAVSLPTAEDCANQLSSIFNSRSVTHANTMSPPQKEETDQKSNTQSYQPSKSIRWWSYENGRDGSYKRRIGLKGLMSLPLSSVGPI